MSDSYGATCFICGKTYYNDTETYIKVKRIERDGTTRKTTKWDGMVCDKCIDEHFLKAVMRNERVINQAGDEPEQPRGRNRREG